MIGCNASSSVIVSTIVPKVIAWGAERRRATNWGDIGRGYQARGEALATRIGRLVNRPQSTPGLSRHIAKVSADAKPTQAM